MAMTQTGPTQPIRMPASGGPTMVANPPMVLSTALAGRWCRCGSSSAIRVNRPAEPHECSSADAASRTTYSPMVSTPARWARGIAASAAARRIASHPASWAPLRPRSNRPKMTVPAALGRVYAAMATAIQVPR